MASTKLVLKPTKSSPALSTPSLQSDADSDGEKGMLSSFVLKCQVLEEDLNTALVACEDLVSKGPINKYSVEAELRDLEKFSDEYNIAYMAIVRICEKSKIDIADYQKKKQRFTIKSKAIRNTLFNALPTEIVKETEQSLKLPKIEIPVFSGKFDSWISWYRLYDSMVFKNSRLSAMEKYHFLKSKLAGEPQTLIEGIPFEEGYYQAAHETIVDHYNDPLKRINSHLDAMWGCSSMTADKKQTLRQVMSAFRAHVTGLQILFSENADIDPLSQFVIHSFLTKVDKGTRSDWEREMSRRKRFATFKEFLEYIEGRCNAFERASSAVLTPEKGADKAAVLGAKSAGRVYNLTSQFKREMSCFNCQADHPLFKCEKFLAMAVKDRWSLLKEKGLCSRCFSPRCAQKCSVFCRKCRRNHNSLLHYENKKEQSSTSDLAAGKTANYCMLAECETENSVTSSADEIGKIIPTYQGWLGSLLHNNESLLATAIALVLNPMNMEKVTVRVLLDSASQLNLVSLDLIKRFGLSFYAEQGNIGTVGNCSSHSLGNTELTIYSKTFKFQQNVHCLVVDDIIDSIPNYTFSIEDWNIPTRIGLADPNFNKAQGIDILLGLRFFWKILGTRKLKLGKNLPELRETKLGWIVADDRVSEELELVDSSKTFIVKSLVTDILYSIEQFWAIEEGSRKELTFEEQECERVFLETTFRDEFGRFVVRLPFKISAEKLGQSKFLALKRFLALERRFLRDPKLKAEYTKCIQDYLQQGHMKEIIDEIQEQKGFYIPHHAIFKELSTSTKLRIVFDASMLSLSGLSLNDCLMVGSVVQPDLFTILLRFRTHKFVFTADITQMYRSWISA